MGSTPPSWRSEGSASLPLAVAAIVLRDRPARVAGLEEAVPWTMRDRRLWLLSAASGSTWSRRSRSPASSSLPARRAGPLDRKAAPGPPSPRCWPSACVAAGRWSDRVRASSRSARRARDLQWSWSAPRCSAPLWVPLPALVAATALSMTWNGLSFTAAAELAGSARSGAALGFQQTTPDRRRAGRAGVRGARGRSLVARRLRPRGTWPACRLGSPRPATRARGAELTRRR